MKQIVVGAPFNTEAIINQTEITKVDIDYINDFLDIDTNCGFKLSYSMGTHDIVYGLGENVGGINKRGGLYDSFCTDEFDHSPDKKSLYGAHNFIIIDGIKTFGLFIDHPGKVSFDVGYTDKDILKISGENSNFNLFVIEEDSLNLIVKKFREAIGLSYVPPKWAFGFQQSRWSYPDDKSITEIADKFIENDIPCDCIYMDIDYMKDYKNFTVDNYKFPNFPEFVKKIKDKGFRLIPIIDAGCKKEDGYSINDEGLENGFYCVDENGKPFVGAVWPGKVHFPDFLNAKARKWFGDKYKFLIDQGIEGFWNDMNEPAIFYSEKGLQKAFDKIDQLKGKNIDIDAYFDLQGTMSSISNNEEDYKSFYHNVDGELVNHYDVHNLYGYNMTRAASESFNDLYPNKRFLLFSRASSVGMHRYGGIWTGDNKSWWEHLLLNIKMLPSLNMVGFIYSGADVGGFGANANAELVTRWTQAGLFTPLLRNHAALGSRNQEPFSFDKESTSILRDTLQLRYALTPYIYSEFMKSVISSDSYFKPLAFEFSDRMSKRTENQILVGESVMIAPIYEPNCFGRNIWLPEDMLLWKVNDYKEHNLDVKPKGHHYINLEMNEIPIFIRKNRVLIIGNHASNIESIDNKSISIIAFVDTVAEYTLYDDDGTTDNFKKGDFSELSISINNSNGLDIKLETKGLCIVENINYTIVNSSGVVNKGSVKV